MYRVELRVLKGPGTSKNHSSFHRSIEGQPVDLAATVQWVGKSWSLIPLKTRETLCASLWR